MKDPQSHLHATTVDENNGDMPVAVEVMFDPDTIPFRAEVDVAEHDDTFCLRIPFAQKEAAMLGASDLCHQQALSIAPREASS